jgi:phosphoesterase RecJ-like protein
MVEPQTLSRFREIIATSHRILLSAHRNPDGDAIGSLLGMYFILRGLNKDPMAFCPDGVPRSLSFLPGTNHIAQKIEGQFDATILLDTPERALFPQGFESVGTFVVIDHHIRAEKFGDLVIREPASAVGEILYFLAKKADWPIDAQAAVCLYTSIVSDTSSFRYESATQKSHLAAAALLELGAVPHYVALNLFESCSLTSRRLLAEVLKTLEIGANGKYACMYSTKEMWAGIGATPDDLDGIVNVARGIEGVELAALVREDETDLIRVSLRSKGRMNASSVASRFGGGGHVNAAGFRLQGVTIHDALQQLLTVAEEILRTKK